MDFKAKREALNAAQNELVGQINHIRGQLAIIDELEKEAAAAAHQTIGEVVAEVQAESLALELPEAAPSAESLS